MHYKPLKHFSDYEIKIAMEQNSLEELVLIPLSVGEYSCDPQYAQNICISLLKHSNAQIRANAVLGLSYIARNHGTLDKSVIPLLIYEFQNNMECRERIEYAIEDICVFLDWQVFDHD